ncbi:MAG: SDR family oxidoreductase [Actinobacteria bacterium]|nr:SDR family oxidoreductase [Actinomycetota bacterium]
MQLAGRIALVTGANRGIGREIALGYAREGAHVVLTARDLARLNVVAEEIHALGGACSVRQLDVTDHASIERTVADVVARHGRIDVLCNNAGGNPAPGPLADVPAAAFGQVLALNLVGPHACCRAVLPHMTRQRYGRIINISSGAAIMLNPGEGTYAASKAGLNAMTLVLAKEVHSQNILVNAMSPGSVRTDANPTAKTHPRECVPTAIFLAALPDDGPTGRFFRFMQELPVVPAISIDWSAR